MWFKVGKYLHMWKMWKIPTKLIGSSVIGDGGSGDLPPLIWMKVTSRANLVRGTRHLSHPSSTSPPPISRIINAASITDAS